MFSDLEKTLERRDAQVKRALRGLQHMDRAHAFHVIMSWMSLEEVDEMLEFVDKEGNER